MFRLYNLYRAFTFTMTLVCLILLQKQVLAIDHHFVQQAKMAIVSIDTKTRVSAYADTNWSSGTGFLIDKDKGLILTNRHIVKPESVSDYTITFFNGKEIKAEFEYADPWLDFGLLKIDPKALPEGVQALEISSQPVQLDEQVMIIGNNGGENFSIQTGYVSGLYNSVGYFPCQTLRISLNTRGGSSGSPILNKDGKVVGLNFAGGEISAIAIPTPYFSDALQEMFRDPNGLPSRKHTGAILDFYSLDHAKDFRNFPEALYQEYVQKFPNSMNKILQVQSAIFDSPAESKLQPGDIIWAIDGKIVSPNIYEVDRLMNQAKAKQIQITIVRDGKKLDVSVDLYNLWDYKLNRFVKFGNVIFYEPDNFVRYVGGTPKKGLFVTNFFSGASFNPDIHVPKDMLWLFQILKMDRYPTESLDDVIKIIPNLVQQHYFPVMYKSYSSFLGYNEVSHYSRQNLMTDVEYNIYAENPVLYEFDQKTKRWDKKELNQKADK